VTPPGNLCRAGPAPVSRAGWPRLTAWRQARYPGAAGRGDERVSAAARPLPGPLPARADGRPSPGTAPSPDPRRPARWPGRPAQRPGGCRLPGFRPGGLVTGRRGSRPGGAGASGPAAGQTLTPSRPGCPSAGRPARIRHPAGPGQQARSAAAGRLSRRRPARVQGFSEDVACVWHFCRLGDLRKCPAVRGSCRFPYSAGSAWTDSGNSVLAVLRTTGRVLGRRRRRESGRGGGWSWLARNLARAGRG
jgi:hypothetical protein